MKNINTSHVLQTTLRAIPYLQNATPKVTKKSNYLTKNHGLMITHGIYIVQNESVKFVSSLTMQPRKTQEFSQRPPKSSADCAKIPGKLSRLVSWCWLRNKSRNKIQTKKKNIKTNSWSHRSLCRTRNSFKRASWEQQLSQQMQAMATKLRKFSLYY